MLCTQSWLETSSLQVAPQVFWSLVAAAVRTPQVTGDKGIPGAFRLVRAAVAAFDIFNVVAQAAHDAAEEAGMQTVAEFGQQRLDDLHGDLADIVADDQAVRAGHAYPQDAPDITQQHDCRLNGDRALLRTGKPNAALFDFL